MPDRVFRDRRDAGRALARILARCRDRGDVLVLALPRGGVPVAFEVAMVLDFVGWMRERNDRVGVLRSASRSAEALRAGRLERALGVIYRPSTERESHYFRAHLAAQFDVVIHIDDTRAVEPLERTARWDCGEVPETFPHAV